MFYFCCLSLDGTVQRNHPRYLLKGKDLFQVRTQAVVSTMKELSRGTLHKIPKYKRLACGSQKNPVTLHLSFLNCTSCFVLPSIVNASQDLKQPNGSRLVIASYSFFFADISYSPSSSYLSSRIWLLQVPSCKNFPYLV